MYIRNMEKIDIPFVVDINIEMWKKTYKEIINEEIFLMREKNRENSINIMKEKLENKENFYKVVYINNKIIGFVSYGKNRDIAKDNLGEVYAIYILEEFHEKGIGKKLISYAKNDLKEKGYTSLVIWTLEENPNKKFYEKLGGKEFSNRQIDILGQKLKEIGYLYENI